MSKKTRKITMTVFCRADDAEEVKASLVNDDGDDWYTDHDCLLAGINVKVEEPSDQEEASAHKDLLGDDEPEYSPVVLQNVAEALGYEPDPERIAQAIAECDELDDQTLKVKLKKAEKTFQDNGGRGVDLADDIDNMRIALAVRETKDEDVTP